MAEDLAVIVGLGMTAMSTARYLHAQKIPFALVDTRANPPQLADFKKQFPAAEIHLGGLDQNLLQKAGKLIVSPGVSIKTPEIATQIAQGKAVVGDIELFAKAISSPVIAITGTNAKSTVTTLIGMMAKTAGLRTEVGGNIGVPALDLNLSAETDVFVLELSSFQLETTFSLAPRIATILNVTPDHMDRYDSLQDYCVAKHRIYSQCEIAVCNRDDPATYPDAKAAQRTLQFTLNTPGENEFGLLDKNGEMFLAFEDKTLLAVRELPVLGRHYQANALASLALGAGFGLPMDAMLKTLIDFQGLEHRCQLVRQRNNVNWYNDSKGTNVGATIAAIEGLGAEIPGKLILIAGGVGKNADFSPLVMPVAKYARKVILIGEAAPLLTALLQDRVEIATAGSMEAAVAIADGSAQAGDSVLLSPACASFDMFNNFEHRGQVFAGIVQGLK